MKIYLCKICNHLEFNSIPDKCPVCWSGQGEFESKDSIFKESSEKSPEAEVKHVPSIVVSKQCGLIPEGSCFDILVRIGKTLHPMQEKHYITFIDCYQNDVFSARISFTPNGINPAGCFHLQNGGGKVTIVENCNIHGFWKSEATI